MVIRAPPGSSSVRRPPAHDRSSWVPSNSRVPRETYRKLPPGSGGCTVSVPSRISVRHPLAVTWVTGPFATACVRRPAGDTPTGAGVGLGEGDGVGVGTTTTGPGAPLLLLLSH